jgi:excisionase family DNA binding protein
MPLAMHRAGAVLVAVMDAVDAQSRFVRPKVASERLGLSRSFMYVLLDRGDIESVRCGRARLIPVDALTTFADELRDAEKNHAAVGA